MKNKIQHLFIVLFVALLVGSIFLIRYNIYQNNPAKTTLDIDESGMGHGHNLTTYGCLTNGPWETTDFFIVHGFEIETKLLVDPTHNYSTNEREVVFSLNNNHIVKYFFKNDTLNNSKKPIWYTGNWSINLKDSAIKINYTNSPYYLDPIIGKLICASPNDLTILDLSTKNNSSIKTLIHYAFPIQ